MMKLCAMLRKGERELDSLQSSIFKQILWTVATKDDGAVAAEAAKVSKRVRPQEKAGCRSMVLRSVADSALETLGELSRWSNAVAVASIDGLVEAPTSAASRRFNIL